jgi:hypothetical protein
MNKGSIHAFNNSFNFRGKEVIFSTLNFYFSLIKEETVSLLQGECMVEWVIFVKLTFHISP